MRFLCWDRASLCICDTPVGGPGVRVSVLPWPEGPDGEICLGGPGIARGYLELPELTAARFCCSQQERCYRTGDSGRWMEGPDGRLLQVLGRRDLQVKLNGERIELGEVEHLLSLSPLVRQCAAMPWGQGNLLAYVVLEDGEILDGVAYLCLTAHCDKHLPRVMRPRRFVSVEALPMTPNGKIDRHALPQPGFEMSQKAYQLDTVVSEAEAGQSLTSLEKAIVLAWASELSLSEHWKLGPDADFYALGGGSVQAVRVTRVLRAVLHGGGGGKARWAEGNSDWRNPAGDASLFLAPERAGDAECHFGLCDGGPFAPCALLERPILRQYAHFLASSGVRTSQTDELPDVEAEEAVLPRALESAIRSNREILAHALLVAGADATGDLSARAGTTPLHWASSKCEGSMVQLLVSYGASVVQLGFTSAVALSDPSNRTYFLNSVPSDQISLK